jgi:hypothetical protein
MREAVLPLPSANGTAASHAEVADAPRPEGWEAVLSELRAIRRAIERDQSEAISAKDAAAEIAGPLADRPCASLTRAEAQDLLERGRSATQTVSPDRLGKVGRADDYCGYACETGYFLSHEATIPVVVEAWANRAYEPGGIICVNRTPVVCNIEVRREQGADYAIFGCQLAHQFTAGRKDTGEFQVRVNIITPHVPLTSSGKDPDLTQLREEILGALEKAIRVAKRTSPRSTALRQSQKEIIHSRIAEAAKKLSGDGQFLFSLRQLFYELRPYLIQAIGREPQYGTFSKIVGAFEDRHGDVENLYRDDRGTLYHPHTGESIPLGTRSVAEYQRPALTFRSILFAEKEGLFPQLKHARWPERFDCALCNSKGFARRAARGLIRLLVKSGEAITVFVIHDADGPGTLIFEALQRALEPHGIKVVNLGLDPAEARSMGLADEPVNRKGNKRVPVADYVPTEDQEWLQEHRIELNAMSTPQFIEWLSTNVRAHFAGQPHKVLPPPKALKTQLEHETRAALEHQSPNRCSPRPRSRTVWRLSLQQGSDNSELKRRS